MAGKPTTAFDVAQRLLGIHALPGPAAQPFIAWALSLVGQPSSDEVPHCSAFVYAIAYLMGLPRPLELPGLARAWLLVGEEVALADAQPGFDVVIFKRGQGAQPPASVIQAPGHVALFSLAEKFDPLHDEIKSVRVLGANQGAQHAVSYSSFPVTQVLGVRRLWDGT